MNGYLYNRGTGKVTRIVDQTAEPDEEQPEVVAVFLDTDSEKLKVAGWMVQSSNRKNWWMSYPPGSAAEIALALSREVKLSDAENRLIDSECERYNICTM